MVIVRAIGGRAGSADARIVEAIETGQARLAISDAGVNELIRVMGYPQVEALITTRPGGLARAFRAALNLAMMGTLYYPRGLDWPNLRDPNDAWLLDLALASEADHIVTRDKGMLRDAPSQASRFSRRRSSSAGPDFRGPRTRNGKLSGSLRYQEWRKTRRTILPETLRHNGFPAINGLCKEPHWSDEGDGIARDGP